MFSATSSSIALRTVPTLMPKRSESRRSAGIASPGFHSPRVNASVRRFHRLVQRSRERESRELSVSFMRSVCVAAESARGRESRRVPKIYANHLDDIVDSHRADHYDPTDRQLRKAGRPSASHEGLPVIHCVLHDPDDSVAVVVVEGVKAGTPLTGLILDEDRTIALACVPGHSDRPQGRAEGHGRRRHRHQVRRRHRQGRAADPARASMPTCTTSRRSGGEAHVTKTPLPGLPARERPRRRAQPRDHPAGRRPVERRRRGGRQQHQGHAGDPASVRAAAVRRRPRPAFPHADRRRAATPTSPRSS